MFTTNLNRSQVYDEKENSSQKTPAKKCEFCRMTKPTVFDSIRHSFCGKNRKKALKSQKTDKNGDRINKSRDKAHKKGNKNNTNVALILELLSAVKVLSVSQVGSFGTNDAAISGMGSGGFFGIMTLLGFLTDGFESFIPAWEDEFSLSSEIKIGVRPIDLAARFLQFKKKEKKKSRRFESVKPLKKLQNNV